MDIISLVTAGVSKLIELIPLWSAAGEKERAEIIERAKSLVAGLDAMSAAADAKDNAATEAAKAALGGTD